MVHNEQWCWWCCHPIPRDIFQMPIQYDELRTTFKTIGQFCDFGCMKAYANSQECSHKQSRLTLISKFYKHVTGNFIHNHDIPMAPPRQCLKVFGGIMDITEFRSSRNTMIVVNPPIVTMKQSIEQQSCSNYRWLHHKLPNNNENGVSLKDFKNSQKVKINNVPMKIKNVPSTSKHITLDMVLGIKSHSINV
jgi:hypothetical protein